MKKIKGLLLFAVAMLSVGCANNETEKVLKPGDIVEQTESYYKIVDMMGDVVTIENDDDDFACIGPGALRQFCYVADPSQLKAIEVYETTASKATRPYINKVTNIDTLPTFGGGGQGTPNTDKERLAAINPDVVFCAWQNESFIEILRDRYHLNVVAVGYNADGLFANDIYTSLKMIGKITKHEKRAEEVVNYFESCKQELSNIAKDNKKEIKAYVGAINRKGKHHFSFTTENYLPFDILGITNVAKTGKLGNYVDFDLEALIPLQPDIVFVDAGGLSNVKQDIKNHENTFKLLNAYNEKKFYIQMPCIFYSNNFDVSLANAYYIAMTVFPEKFENITIKEKFNEITNFLLGINCYDALTNEFNCDYGSFFE